MKVTLTIEDIETAKIYTHAIDMYCAITKARDLIRRRRKHGEVSKEEFEFLDHLMEELYIGGIDEWG